MWCIINTHWPEGVVCDGGVTAFQPSVLKFEATKEIKWRVEAAISVAAAMDDARVCCWRKRNNTWNIIDECKEQMKPVIRSAECFPPHLQYRGKQYVRMILLKRV